jgi:hypothetical protein
MVLFSVSNVAPTVITQRVQVYRNTVLYIVGNFIDDCRKLIIKVKMNWSLLPSVLQFFILILNFLIKTFNVVLLALCAVFDDSEWNICCQLCEVQTNKNLLLSLSFESCWNLLTQNFWVLRVAKICSWIWCSEDCRNLSLVLEFWKYQKSAVHSEIVRAL